MCGYDTKATVDPSATHYHHNQVPDKLSTASSGITTFDAMHFQGINSNSPTMTMDQYKPLNLFGSGHSHHAHHHFPQHLHLDPSFTPPPSSVDASPYSDMASPSFESPQGQQQLSNNHNQQASSLSSHHQQSHQQQQHVTSSPSSSPSPSTYNGSAAASPHHHPQQRNPFIGRSACVVCGDRARGCNFGAITCASCKEFFRRNAFKLNVSNVRQCCICSVIILHMPHSKTTVESTEQDVII